MRLTPPEQRARPANFPQSSASLWRLGGAIGIAGAGRLRAGASSTTPSSTSTPISPRATTRDLFFDGKVNDPAWLDYFAFDLQPLPKYFIGAGLRAADLRMPVRTTRPGGTRMPHPLRSPGDVDDRPRPVHRGGGDGLSRPSSRCGTVIGGRLAGTIAALLLMINPLVPPPRPSGDVRGPVRSLPHRRPRPRPFAWSEPGRARNRGLSLLGFALAGVCSGLSILCKFNGLLAPLIIVAWCPVGLLVPGLAGAPEAGDGRRRRADHLILAVWSPTWRSIRPSPPARPAASTRSSPHAQPGPVSTDSSTWSSIAWRARPARRGCPSSSLTSSARPPTSSRSSRYRDSAVSGRSVPPESDSEVRYQLAQDWGLVSGGRWSSSGWSRRSGWAGVSSDGRAPDRPGPLDLGGGELDRRGRLHPAGLGPLPAADPGTQRGPGRCRRLAGSGNVGERRRWQREADISSPPPGSSSSCWEATHSSGTRATGIPPAG